MRCYFSEKRYVVRQAVQSAAAGHDDAIQEVRGYIRSSWMSGIVDAIDNGPDGVLLISRSSRGVKREITRLLQAAGLPTALVVRYV